MHHRRTRAAGARALVAINPITGMIRMIALQLQQQNLQQEFLAGLCCDKPGIVNARLVDDSA